MSPEQPQLDPARDGRFMGGPAWRVDLAEQLLATRRRLHEAVDPVVRERVAFARLVLGGAQGAGQAAERFPAIAAAEKIQHAEGVAAKLKILVIGNCEPRVIAGRLGLDEAAIEAWEKLYFDVRPALSASDWIAARVIEPHSKAGDAGLTSRLRMAYAGGPAVALAALDADAKLPLTEGDQLFRKKLLLALKLDEALAMPLNSGTDALRLFKLQNDLYLGERRLELDRARLEHHCAEAIKTRELAEQRLQAYVKRDEQRAEARRRRDQERAQHRAARLAAMARGRDPRREQEEARARAAASPLAALRWKRPAGPPAGQGRKKTINEVPPRWSERAESVGVNGAALDPMAELLVTV